jgi:hypothetical protein
MAKHTKSHGMKPADKKLGGRPSKYQPEYSDLVLKLCLFGATERNIADL